MSLKYGGTWSSVYVNIEIEERREVVYKINWKPKADVMFYPITFKTNGLYIPGYVREEESSGVEHA